MKRALVQVCRATVACGRAARPSLGILSFVTMGCGRPAPPPRAPAAGLNACQDLPVQTNAPDDHVIKFELRSSLELTGVCFNSGGHRVTPEAAGGGAQVFALRVKKAATLVKYHLHASAGTRVLDYDNEIRASKHADDVVKLTVLERDGQLDATQAR